MAERRDTDPTRASRLEILGAWLSLWTPPRDVVIPPVPWRTVAAAAAALAVAAVLVAVLVAPAIDRAKDDRSAGERRALDERRAARRVRQRREQTPRTGRLDTGGSRAAALRGVEVAIGVDARRRFDRDAAAATCEPLAGTDASARRVAYDCLSSVRAIVGGGEQAGARGELGIPYRAVLDFAGGGYAFCKINPIPGEQVIPDPRDLVQLSRPCRTPGA